jgi:branched-chain amino acid aminotransferase
MFDSSPPRHVARAKSCAEVSLRDRQGYETAIAALRDVAAHARVWVSMPVLEGITPRALVESREAVDSLDPSGLRRRDGIFRLDEIGLSAMDHVALYGDAVFEGILIRNHSIFLYRDHLERLESSAAKIALQIPMDRYELTNRLLETCRRVEFPDGAGYIRLVVTRGIGDLGINPMKCITPTVFAIVSTIRLYAREAYQRGIPLGLTRRIRRPSAATLDPNIKSNNYLNNVLALIEGTKNNGYVESLMLTPDGYVSEATVDNIFSVLKHPGWETDPAQVEVRTPSSIYCLVGITRASVMKLAQRRGYRVTVRDDLLPIDLIGPGKECFMTGTGAGVMPITRIEDVDVGDGRPGPITMGLVDDIGQMMSDPSNGLPIDTPREAIAEAIEGRAPASGRLT